MTSKTIYTVSAVLFAVLTGVALAGSAPTEQASSSCHGNAKAAKASCHGTQAKASCHGEKEEAGCHGSSFASRRADRLERRASRIEDRRQDRADRVAARSSCHGKQAAPVDQCGSCDCGCDNCDCRE